MEREMINRLADWLLTADINNTNKMTTVGAAPGCSAGPEFMTEIGPALMPNVIL